MEPLPWFAPPALPDTGNVVIVGAGLAGCHLARTLQRRSVPVTLIDARESVATEASANSSCVLRPHVTRTAGIHNQFNEAAFSHAKATLGTLINQGEAVACGFPGVLQLLRQQSSWPVLSTGQVVDAARSSALAGIKLDTPALHFANAGWVDAASYCNALLAARDSRPSIDLILNTRVAAIEAVTGSSRWDIHVALTGDGKKHLIRASTLVLCCGVGIKQIAHTAALPLQISSGQTTRCYWQAKNPIPKTVICGKHYLIPHHKDVTVGATHWRNNVQTRPDEADDALNIAGTSALAAELPDALVAAAHWRSLRASTPDRLPLVGAVPDQEFYQQAYSALRHGPRHRIWPKARYLDGLYVFGGLGSRGAGTASLCAELLADQIIGPEQNSETAGTVSQRQSWSTLLHPARFFLRQLKRTPPAAADGILGNKNR